MTTKNSNQRVSWIDAVRVFALVCIIVTHIVGPRVTLEQKTALFMAIGSATLFFMASGALVLPLDKPALPWLRHRFMAIGIPMVIWGVFYIFIYKTLGIPHYLDTIPAWKRILSVFWAQRGSLWFMNALLGLYLVVPLISPWVKQASKRSVEILLLAWLIIGVYPFISLFYGIGYGQPAQLSIIGGLYGFFGYFIMGYYFMHWPLKKRNRKEIATVISLLLCLSAVGIALFGPALRNNVAGCLLDDLAVNNMAWFSLIFALFSFIPQLKGRWQKAISFLGRGVFGAYLAMSFVQDAIVDPHIADPAIASIVAVTLSFAIGLTLRHIPVVGKYLA